MTLIHVSSYTRRKASKPTVYVSKHDQLYDEVLGEICVGALREELSVLDLMELEPGQIERMRET